MQYPKKGECRNTGRTHFKKGCVSWNKGKKWNKETREKMRQAKLKKPTNYWLGKFRSEETKRKISLAKKGKKANISEDGKIKQQKFFRENNPNKGKIGKKHPCWVKNKKSPFLKSIRELYQYREWRIAIFKRDNFTCVLCKKEKSGYLQADHYPIRFIDIIKKFNINTLKKAVKCKPLWDINNGRTLCVKCHRQTPTWGRVKKK